MTVKPLASGPPNRSPCAFRWNSVRRRANLTRAEVTSQIAVSEAVVGRWERGVRVLSLASLRRYADVTGSRLRIDLVE